jgi:hypothetical protein
VTTCALIVVGAAVYTLGAVGLAIHGIRAEEDRAYLWIAPVWPFALVVGLALAAWPKSRNPATNRPYGE